MSIENLITLTARLKPRHLHNPQTLSAIHLHHNVKQQTFLTIITYFCS